MGIEPEGYAAFIEKLCSDLVGIPGDVLPPIPLLSRVWALSTDAPSVYVEACCTTPREQKSTRWEIVRSDGTHLVHVVGVNEGTERWQRHEQEYMATSMRLEQDAVATVTAVRRRLRDVDSVETSGNAMEWFPTPEGPSRPMWTLVFRDGGRVTIPLQPNPTPEVVASARRLALLDE